MSHIVIGRWIAGFLFFSFFFLVVDWLGRFFWPISSETRGDSMMEHGRHTLSLFSLSLSLGSDPLPGDRISVPQSFWFEPEGTPPALIGAPPANQNPFSFCFANLGRLKKSQNWIKKKKTNNQQTNERKRTKKEKPASAFETRFFFPIRTERKGRGRGGWTGRGGGCC